MKTHIKLLVIMAGGDITAEIELAAETPVASLPAAAMQAVWEQHPHLVGQPISGIRYDVHANAGDPAKISGQAYENAMIGGPDA